MTLDELVAKYTASNELVQADDLLDDAVVMAKALSILLPVVRRVCGPFRPGAIEMRKALAKAEACCGE